MNKKDPDIAEEGGTFLSSDYEKHFEEMIWYIRASQRVRKNFPEPITALEKSRLIEEEIKIMRME
jgi:hypothetical protein